MVLLAFSLQDQIEKYGAYVGIASFFGLAILSLLYFAQAREVKRLRDWAGRAPERAAEVEALAIEHAEEARRVEQPPAPAPAARPTPATAAAAVANGAVKLTPAEVAALAFARAAGVHTPHPPRPHPAPVPAAAPATEAAGAATAPGAAAAVQDLSPASNGHGTGTVPPPVAPGEAPAPAEPAVPGPATPAARRAEAPPAGGEAAAPPRIPAPAAPLRATPPPRRPAPRRPISARPARRESSTRAVVLTVVVGVLVLGAAAFAVTQLFGGGGDTPAKPPKVAQSTPASPTASASATGQATAAPSKATMRVAVYNGTAAPGLAGGIADQLGNLGYNRDNVGADTYTPNQQRQASVVMYERGDRPAAAEVARSLSISDVRLIDSATQQFIDQSGKKWDVVVIVGADKSQ